MEFVFENHLPLCTFAAQSLMPDGIRRVPRVSPDSPAQRVRPVDEVSLVKSTSGSSTSSFPTAAIW
jgi:hypothetical protein